VKKKLLLVFIIIITMPITVITVMAIFSYKNSEMQKMERIKEEAREILLINDRLLQNRIRLIENELDLLPLDSAIDVIDLRGNMNSERLVKQAFIISDSDTFIYPSGESEISGREMSFLEEAENIELISNLKARISPGESRENQSSWYTWFMGDGINFVYFTPGENEIRGFLVERYALISQLINVLPQSNSEDKLFKIQLTDARGNLLYQWGQFNKKDKMEPLEEYSLAEPLNSWRLFYYYNSDIDKTAFSSQRSLLVVIGLLLLTVLIILLASYFYRENSREMKLAGQKVTFVNQVSHELKTPLTNIRLYSELLQNILTEKNEVDFLNIIINESSRLGRMINNVLTFNKGEQGELKIKSEKTDMNLLISQVLEKFYLLLQENEMEVDYKEQILPIISTDSDMIEQILVNIVGNSIKYASSGKFISIKTEITAEFLIISIRDKGPGINDTDREKIFKPFYRIDNSLSQKSSGTGIGLSIARTLANETGSVLKLDKSDIGAVFSLSIPLLKELPS